VGAIGADEVAVWDDSFTGEDIVELHTHGSVAVVSGVLEALSHVPV
jgi:tRNA U34 5-carboxymethylaminomethyl modifying GTPase MnmE/TrmE